MGQSVITPILLVDNTLDNLLDIEKIIQREEVYNVYRANTVTEAIQLIEKYEFALILINDHLVKNDNYKLFHDINSKNIPMIGLSEETYDSSIPYGEFIDVIHFPINPTLLANKVASYVKNYQITKQLKAEKQQLTEIVQKLKMSNEQLHQAFYSSLDAQLLFDQQGIILKINPAAIHLFQYTEEELLGHSIFRLVSDNESKAHLESILLNVNNFGFISESEYKAEFQASKKEKIIFPAEMQVAISKITDSFLFSCTVRDLTNQKNQEENIKYIAYHDQLTDLPNRRLLNIKLADELQAARKNHTTVGVLFLDMDRFKFINDSLGHTIGDKVLREIASRLQMTVRPTDFVARIGGDEFSVILPSTDREMALQVAEEILKAFIDPLIINNYELYVTTCIGLSIFPYDGDNVLDLLKNADAALYRAKEQGKNNYNVFHSGLNIQSYRSFKMQNDLRYAIERKELELFYQPRVNIETGKVESSEALLRWNHPNWGILSPREFISLAEETGQIVEIGEWVVKSVCNQINEWSQAGLTPIRVAINLSIQEFFQKDLVSYIKQILVDTGISPHLLEIEITESVILNNEELSAKTLHQLSDLGISISIDDFGTGYSSLYHLSKLPINTLKIDQSFINGIENETSHNRSIISTIIKLAQSLNISVIAEGVETEQQLDFLRNEQCKEVQGYLFSPPILPEEMQEIFIAGNYNVSLFENAHPLNSANEGSKNQSIIQSALQQIQEIYSISSRETEVFELILAGLSNKEISEQLYISEHTVKNHLTRIFQKLDVSDRAQAMAMVYQICINQGDRFTRVKP